MEKNFRIKIKYPNGSLYWVDHFNSIEILEKWLEEERTRPYWDETWIVEIYELDNQGQESIHGG
jgi:hypothetical protein